MAAETIDGATWLTPGEQSQPALLRLPLDHSGRGTAVDLDRRCHPPADLQSRYGDQGASLQAQLDAFAAEMLGP